MKKLLITLVALTCYFGSPLNAMSTSNQVTRTSSTWQGTPNEVHQSIFEFLTDKDLVSKLATLSKADLERINAYFARIYPDWFFESQKKLFYPESNMTPLTSLCKVAKLNTIPDSLQNEDYAFNFLVDSLCNLYPNNTYIQSCLTALHATFNLMANNALRLVNDTSLTEDTRNSLLLVHDKLFETHKNLIESIILELFTTARKEHFSSFIYYFNLVSHGIFRDKTIMLHDFYKLCAIIKSLPHISNKYLRTTLFNQLHTWMNEKSEILSIVRWPKFHLELLGLYKNPAMDDLVNQATRETLINTLAELLISNRYADHPLNTLRGIQLLTQFVTQGVMSPDIVTFIQNLQDEDFRLTHFGEDLAFNQELLAAIEKLITEATKLEPAARVIIE